MEVVLHTVFGLLVLAMFIVTSYFILSAFVIETKNIKDNPKTPPLKDVLKWTLFAVLAVLILIFFLFTLNIIGSELIARIN